MSNKIKIDISYFVDNQFVVNGSVEFYLLFCFCDSYFSYYFCISLHAKDTLIRLTVKGNANS